MAKERVDLKKNVFSKAQYTKTIDTSFNELGVTTVTEDLQSQTSIEDFFVLYDELFYDIPKNCIYKWDIEHENMMKKLIK